MRIRRALSALFLAQIAACSGANIASTPSPSATTVCALSMHGKELNGTSVRFHATYITDLRHGAFFTDENCPMMSVEYGADATNADPSVQNFNDVVKGSILDRSERKFVVDVSGKFTWNPDGRPHGIITLMKVWSYERVSKTGSSDSR